MASNGSKKKTKSGSLSKDKTPFTPQQVLAVNTWMNEVLGQDTAAENFFSSLHDGTRLCRLLRKYTTNQVNKFERHPKTMEHAKHNLDLFRKACKTTYDLTHNECFENKDLLSKEGDLGAVLHSLYTLSKKLCTVAQQRSIVRPICDPTPFGDAR